MANIPLLAIRKSDGKIVASVACVYESPHAYDLRCGFSGRSHEQSAARTWRMRIPTKKTSGPQDHDAALRQHLLELLHGGHAHADFDIAVRGLSPALRGKTPKGAEHSPWAILEHLRIAQWDILEFSRECRPRIS